MAGANGITGKSGPTRASATAPMRQAASPAGVSRSSAIARMRAAARMINGGGSPAEIAAGHRAMNAAIRGLRSAKGTKRAPMARTAPSQKAPAAASTPKALAKPRAVVAPKVTPVAKPAAPIAKTATAKPVAKHGPLEVRANKDGSFSIHHSQSGREVSGGLTKNYAKQLASHFGKNSGSALMRAAQMGDAKAKKGVDDWLAEGRRRSAPKLTASAA